MTSSANGNNAPLWFMIILWTILALSVLLALVILILKLREFILSLKSMNYLKPNNFKKTDFTTISKTLLEFFGGLHQFIQKWVNLLKSVVTHFVGIRPTSIKALFSYYLWWGRRIGIKKYNYETPQEYLKRLRNELEGAYPELVASLSQLTLAHEKQCYGVYELSITEQELKEIFSTLVKYKRIKKQIKGDRNFIQILKDSIRGGSVSS